MKQTTTISSDTTTIRLSPDAQELFISLLLDPPPLTDALLRAIQLHRSTVISEFTEN